MTLPVRTVGSINVSIAGLGCGNFGFFIDEARSRDIVHAALDAGIAHFDTADVYGEGLSEQYLGRALGLRRGEVVVTTKFGSSTPPGGVRPASAEWTTKACEASLDRLGMDHIDLYLLHQPDPGTPIEETLEALCALREKGMVREIGCSNFTAAALAEAAAAADRLGIPPFRAVQNSYSLLDRTAEDDLIPTALRLDVALLPYLPLASGMLTGKYRRGNSPGDVGRLGLSLRGTQVSDYFPALMIDECFDIVETLERYATDHDRTLAELALAWLASKPYVASVIAGATSCEQLAANFEALSRPPLTRDEQRDVERLTRSDVAFTWNAGFPDYSHPPAEADRTSAPDVRKQPTGTADVVDRE